MPATPISLLRKTSKSPEIVGTVDSDLIVPLIGQDGVDSNFWTTVGNLLSGSVTLDHGGLTGLGDDDHPQYFNGSRADAWLGGKTSNDIAEGTINLYMSPSEKTEALAGPNDRTETTSPPVNAKVEIQLTNGTIRSTRLDNLPGGGSGGVTDHSQLTGLGNDDHTQYHTDARALTWLGSQDSDALPEGSANLYMTSAEKTTALNGPNDWPNNPAPPLDARVEVQLTDDTRLSTTLGNLPGGGGVTDHGSLTGLANDDHLQYHTEARALAWIGGVGLGDTGITDSEIKSAYESNADTNAFTDANLNRLAALPFDNTGNVNANVTFLDTFGVFFEDSDGEEVAYIGPPTSYRGLALYTDDPQAIFPVADPGTIDIYGAGVFISSHNTAYFGATGAFEGARLELGAPLTLPDSRVVHPLVFVDSPPASNIQTDTDPGPAGPLTNAGIGTIIDSGLLIVSDFDYSDGARFEFNATVVNGSTRTGTIYCRVVVNGTPGAWFEYTVLSSASTPWNISGLITTFPATGQNITLEFYADSGNHNQFNCTVTGMSLLIEQPGAGDQPVSHSGLTNLTSDDHPQYHTDARASIWLGTENLGTLATLDAAGKNITNVGTVGGANMGSVPTANEKAALVGAQSAASAPSGSNRYTTDNDTRLGVQETRDPLNTDDDTATPPFVIGSRWINTVADTEFVCVEASTGAAKWVETTATGGGPSGPPELLGTAAMPPTLGMGRSFETTAAIAGTTVANHFILGVHIPGGLTEISSFGCISVDGTATVTITNNSTTNLAGLSGNMTIIARAIS